MSRQPRRHELGCYSRHTGACGVEFTLAMTPGSGCIFPGCVATWKHWHGGFPGGYDDPAHPEGPPIPFEDDDPDPAAVRDYNGAALPVQS